MIEFTPPELNMKLPEWATYIVGRRPEWKIHNHRGNASNALSYHGYGKIYRIIDGKWELQADWVKPKYCDSCTRQLTRYETRTYDPKFPIYLAKVICSICRPKFTKVYDWQTNTRSEPTRNFSELY